MYGNRTGYTVAVYSADKPGPQVAEQTVAVTFRIKGEKGIRSYIFLQDTKNPNPFYRQQANTQAQQFVDLRCRAFLQLDAYNPQDRSFKSAKIVASDVDYFYCDHPEVKS